jgi:prolyl oligopeptidase family protein
MNRNSRAIDLGVSEQTTASRSFFTRTPCGRANPLSGDVSVLTVPRNVWHSVHGTKYPAVLLMTGANDPRVDPWQVDKMAARLQAATTSGKPVLLRVNYPRGHQTIGGTAEQKQRVLADQWSFLLWQFGMPAFQPIKK